MTYEEVLKNVTIEYKSIKNMYLRVNSDGSLHVTCNRRVTRKQIAEFIVSRQSWIEKQRQKAIRKNDKEPFVNRRTVTVLGKKYPVKIVMGNRNKLAIEENTFVFTLTEDSDDLMQKLFDVFAEKYMKTLLLQRRKYPDQWICENYHLKKPTISLRNMKTRWGSCTPANASIRMNTRLIYYPLECIDAVLLHEYAHLVVPNHSAKFYALIEKYMPEYRRYHAMLKD